MAAQLLTEFERGLTELVLIPSGGGVFEVSVGSDLVFSKKQTGHHEENDVILADVRKVWSKAEGIGTAAGGDNR